MPPPRVASAEPEQSPAHVAAVLESFLAEHPAAVLREDGKVLFDLRTAQYTLSTEHSRCTLHLWSDERNLTRRVLSATLRNGVLRLATQRFGQSRLQTLELAATPERRTISTREATRVRYLRQLERVLVRHFPELKPDGLRTAMDLENSFGPAYARGSLVAGQQAWAVIGVNEEESQAIIDGILTLGILWLHHCREASAGRRVYQGLKLIVPHGAAALTLARLAWLNPAAAQWELYELDQATEELEQREPADHGNLATHLLHLPNQETAQARFAESIAQVLALVPEAMRPVVTQQLRSSSELAFLLHGLEFARARVGFVGNSFRHTQEITIGAGASETPLTRETEPQLRELVAGLFARRSADGDHNDPLYRTAPERWLESMLRQNIQLLDPHLDPAHVYSQVPAFAASDRGMMDLLSVTRANSPQAGRLAVLELKADEDLHLALQGLDYWIRVRWHHQQTADTAAGPTFGLGEFQRHGYFTDIRLSPEPPRLYLVAPALRIHPATETVLRYLAPRVDWHLVALDERWRQQIKVVWRRRSRESS